VTRGDSVTFRVVGSPVTSFSNWRYEPTGHPAIVRSENINTDSWTGPLVLGGKAKVVVIVPGQLSSIPLETTPSMTVNARSWNSVPKAPEKVTGIAPPPGLPSPPVAGGNMGYAAWNLDAVFDGLKLNTDGPNKGLSYVTSVQHADWGGTYFKYEIVPDLEPGTQFYNAQCGHSGYISGSILRANGYEHESGTQRGHYQQYRDKLADPAVNFAKYAEPLIGAVSQTYQTFANTVVGGFATRAGQLSSAADVEACNADFSYDATCTYRGSKNFAPYQPCQ
jgi:hypothetical protein